MTCRQLTPTEAAHWIAKLHKDDDKNAPSQQDASYTVQEVVGCNCGSKHHTCPATSNEQWQQHYASRLRGNNAFKHIYFRITSQQLDDEIGDIFQEMRAKSIT